MRESWKEEVGKGRFGSEAKPTPLANQGRRFDLHLKQAEFLALKHESRILGHFSNPLSGFSMMEQVRLCVV